jgi:hypothetical protein
MRKFKLDEVNQTGEVVTVQRPIAPEGRKSVAPGVSPGLTLRKV